MAQRRDLGRERFIVEELESRCFVRNVRSRVLTFEMILCDISETGLLLRSVLQNYIEYNLGDKLMVTMDMNGKIFDRPIVLECLVANVHHKNKLLHYGVNIIRVDELHKKKFAAGFVRIKETSLQKELTSQD